MSIKLADAIIEHQTVIDRLASLEDRLQAVVEVLATCFASKRTVYVCGNGGSASDAQHFASELTGRFEKDRKGYAAIALTTDCSALTAIGNDYGFEHIFSRQLESLGQEGDVLIVISTSGESANLYCVAEKAQQMNIKSIGLLGRNGGRIAPLVDMAIIVDGQRTSRIQESHIFLLHFLCEAFDDTP